MWECSHAPTECWNIRRNQPDHVPSATTCKYTTIHPKRILVLSNTPVLALSLSTMMLVHKHPMMPLSPSLVHAHRRNPSAPPTVIVQPTRTPGLLSLSKPPRPSPTHNRQLHAQQRHQKAASRPRLPTSVVVDKPTPVLPLPAAPSPLSSPQQQRGRAHVKQSKDKSDASSKALLR